MVVFLVKEFVDLSRKIFQLELGAKEILDNGGDQDLTESACEGIGSYVIAIEEHADQLGLVRTKSRARRFSEALLSQMGIDQLRYELRALREATDDDASDQVFLCLASQHREHYLQYEEPFGWEVSFAFDGLVDEDISEAAKCLALDRPTACVFHLMRVMEHAVQRFGKLNGVSLTRTSRKMTTKEKTWDDILRDLRSKINARSDRTAKGREQKQRDTAICNHLDGVRLAWRNPTMHPKRSYDVNEAQEVFDLVKVFMQQLSLAIHPYLRD